jgi:hypothetical protein
MAEGSGIRKAGAKIAEVAREEATHLAVYASSLFVCFAAVLLLGAGPAVAQGASAERTVSDVFAGVSPEGRRILTEALRDNRGPTEREAATRARKDLLDALAREPFDRAAVEAAMLAEERLLDQQREVRRRLVLDAYARLTPADRRAFVAATRAGEGRQGMMGGR